MAILVIIAVASVAVPTVWAGYVYLRLLRAPVTLPQPHDHQAALSNILDLQALAISEAEAGQEAFFVAHMGCAAPRVWQDDGVLQNLKRMVEAGVEVKLIGGFTGHKGAPLPSPEWPKKFEAKLKAIFNLNQKELNRIFRMREQQLRNYSVVAGSQRRCFAYICCHQEDGRYPTQYFRVYDKKLCEAWKDYLLKEFRKIPPPDD